MRERDEGKKGSVRGDDIRATVQVPFEVAVNGGRVDIRLRIKAARLKPLASRCRLASMKDKSSGYQAKAIPASAGGRQVTC